MIELKVRRVGNSLGVVLPREAVARLQAHELSSLFLTETPEGGYRLTPYDPDFAEKMTKAEDIVRRYRNAIHDLAR